jgi:predicted CoA-binding protein
VDEIGRLLARYRTIHVLGLSANPGRPSHGVARYLQRAGYTVVPINPREDSVLGARSVPSLAECPPPVTFVDVFRRSETLPELTDEILALGSVEVVWLQLGVRDAGSEGRLRDAGITVVADLCIKVEHAARTR